MTIDAASFWAEGCSPNLATVRLRTKVTKGAAHGKPTWPWRSS
jgi:hypothetical protein